MRIHYLQHASFEGPGYVQDWAAAKGHSFNGTMLYDSEVLPAINSFDLLVVMGGPLGVYDEEEYPWLKAEKSFVKSAIDTGKKVIGFCLGAQLIAEALGAKVYPNEHKEIGFFPVELLADNTSKLGLDEFQSPFTTYQWHGDTFDLPKGGAQLASSVACNNQAFIWNDRVIALQFHPEMKPENIEAMITHCGDELVDAPYIQLAKEMRADLHNLEMNHQFLETLLNDWLSN